MLHSRFIFRQVVRSGGQATLFVSCVALAMVILVALNGFSDSIEQAMQKDARALHGGDVILTSRFPFSAPLMAETERLAASGAIERQVRSYGFYSMARSGQNGESLLAAVKVVGPAYPLYGEVLLKSGRPFGEVLVPGSLVVAQSLLERLGLRIGDRLMIGSAALTIADIVVSEPDRPVNVFSLGPRVFVAAADLAALDLLGKGSRVAYKIYLEAGGSIGAGDLAGRLSHAALEGQERVDTFQTARSRLKRFMDNFLFFLNLVGAFTLVLAGIGIYSSQSAFLREKERTIAVMKVLGATSRFISSHYIAVLVLMGLLGTGSGIFAGLLLQFGLTHLFSGLLPRAPEVAVSWQAVLQGLGLGIIVVTLFAFLPVYRLKEIKPAAILRRESAPFQKNVLTYGVLAAIVLFFALLILKRMGALTTGVYLVTGMLVLALVATLASVAILRLIAGATIVNLTGRQALRGLFRPGNATRAALITLTASLTFIFSIYLIERNLNEAYINSYPSDAPNLFFLDIQPEQKTAFEGILGMDATYHPVIRARLLAINGTPINRRKERRRRGDNLGRTFNLTYRKHLLDNETLVAGKRLFPRNFEGIPVSVMDTVAEVPDTPMALGDRISFRIQGVPLTATITSLRSRERESLKPFFYFVFPERVLRDAPHTFFCALRVEKERIAELRNRVVAAFPHVTVIDVTAAAAAIAEVLSRLSGIVRVFTAFSLLAGLLLILSSAFATRFARVQEAVYYKILGARSRFVLSVFTLENLFLGVMGGAMALVFSQATTWIVCRLVLDIPHLPFVLPSLLLPVIAALLAVAAGLAPSLSVIRQKPMGFLKAQADE